jgi:hypothetical protein
MPGGSDGPPWPSRMLPECLLGSAGSLNDIIGASSALENPQDKTTGLDVADAANLGADLGPAGFVSGAVMGARAWLRDRRRRPERPPS